MSRNFLKLTLWVALLLALATLAGCAAAAPAAPELAQPSPTTPAADPPQPTFEPTPEPPLTPTPPPAEESPSEAGKRVAFTLLPEASQASYSVEEIFINDNNKLSTAIGATNVITGSLTLNYDDPTASQFDPFVVDISTLTSDRSRRDRAIRTRWLESRKFPLASFTVTEVRNFPAQPQEGVALDFQLVGNMTLKETTREAIWDVSATLDGDVLNGSATTFLLLEDYNIPVPSILGILKVTDGVTLTLDFTMMAEER